MAPHRAYSLRFLSGRLQGEVVPLEPGRPLVLGRGADADVVLAEEAASRKHARVALDGDGLLVEDLGSTNGTFLNGERVTRARAREGDRIVLGGSLAKLVCPEATPFDAGAAPGDAPAAVAEPRKASAMQGRLEEVPLPDLLQLFGGARKSGLLVLEREGREAHVWLERGQIVGCVLDGRAHLPLDKSFYRLLGWQGGHFELRPAPSEPPQQPRDEDGSLEGLLMEGMRQLDEVARLRQGMPARLARGPVDATERDEADRALVALVEEDGDVDAVLDRTALPDLQAVTRLRALLTAGMLARA